MARAHVQEKFLAEIVGRIDVENEKIGPLMNDDLLRLSQALSQIDLRAGRSLVQGGENCRGQVFLRREDENPSALVRKNSFGRSRDCFVHSGHARAVGQPLTARLTLASRHAASQ